MRRSAWLTIGIPLIALVAIGAAILAWSMTAGRPGAAATPEPTPVLIPEVVGGSYGAAADALDAAGLVASVRMARLPAGLETDPQALAALAGAGIDPASSPFTGTPGETWSVVEQSPAAGTAVEPGAAVDLTLEIALAPVPDLTGKPREAALAELVAAGFDASGITTEGVVTAQQPVGGTPWVVGAPVAATLQHFVEYEAEASIGWVWIQWTPPGSTLPEVLDGARMPWSKTWWDTADARSITVSWPDVGHGTATCRIIVDGVIVSEQSETGRTPTVTCR